MTNVLEKIIATLVFACLATLSTVKMVGVTQQGGYSNKNFWSWLRRKDNLQFNRLAVLSLCLALATAITSLCFSFLGVTWALVLSAVPFFILWLWFYIADRKYALKVSAVRTGRFLRLFGVYYFYTATFSYVFLSILSFLSVLNGSTLYALVAYVPFAVMPMALPLFLSLANVTTGVFERAHNRKFIKRAGQVLDESKILRIAVVGSYGKTTVKNILKTLLLEKYTVVETPASYNTPMGIAKTVTSKAFAEKQVFIAEMGARKAGDITELCALVKPDYAVFTGVCAQHVATFGSEENAFLEKSQILRVGAKRVVCGEELREKIQGDTETVVFAGASNVRNLCIQGTRTTFTLCLGEERIEVQTPLLGRVAAENIALAATLCKEMGLSAEEIASGIAKLTSVPHRLQLLESNGAYILDDGYNCNIRGAQAALEVLGAFHGGRCVVTPGIVEGGVLETELNARLGVEIAKQSLEKVLLVGDTLVGAVREGYERAGGDTSRLTVVKTLTEAQENLSEWISRGDAVLFLNDLPDLY